MCKQTKNKNRETKQNQNMFKKPNSPNNGICKSSKLCRTSWQIRIHCLLLSLFLHWSANMSDSSMFQVTVMSSVSLTFIISISAFSQLVIPQPGYSLSKFSLIEIYHPFKIDAQVNTPNVF